MAAEDNFDCRPFLNKATIGAGFAFLLGKSLPPEDPIFSVNRDLAPPLLKEGCENPDSGFESVIDRYKRPLPMTSDLQVLVAHPDTDLQAYENAVDCDVFPSAEVHQPDPNGLPRPSFRLLEDPVPDLGYPFRRPNNYILHPGTSHEDLEAKVDYDMDTDDEKWTEHFNRGSRNSGGLVLKDHVFELIMDRLEKEAFAKDSEEQNSALYNQLAIDESDDVCSVCFDGMSEDVNQIVYCDGCNVAVHQECYGIPLIPQGSWRCQLCQSPDKKHAQCVLCSTRRGALRKTPQGQWVHLSCATWIPESTLICKPGPGGGEWVEKINIEGIPKGRFNLTCSICRQKVGASIQCAERTCAVAFHVTCARKRRLKMMTMDNADGRTVHRAWCQRHGGRQKRQKKVLCLVSPGCHCGSPCSNKFLQPRFKPQIPSQTCLADWEESRDPCDNDVNGSGSEDGEKGVLYTQDEEGVVPSDGPTRIKAVKTRSKAPTLKAFLGVKLRKMCESIPGVPSHLIEGVFPYWAKKRLERNNMPLLKRFEPSILCSSHRTYGNSRGIRNDRITFRRLRSIRLELDRARILLELVKKREIAKSSRIQCYSDLLDLHCMSHLQRQLNRICNQLLKLDKWGVFCQAVNSVDFPAYAAVISHPMDLGTMKKKIEDNVYSTWQEFEEDFELTCVNAMQFNESKSFVFKEAKSLLARGQEIIAAAFLPPPPPPAPTSPDLNEEEAVALSRPAASAVPGTSSKKRIRLLKVPPISPALMAPAVLQDGARLSQRTTRAQSTSRAMICRPGLLRLLDELCAADKAGTFAAPVSESVAPGYAVVIHRPMDLGSMRGKLWMDNYAYPQSFMADLRLMCNNAMVWNGRNSTYSIQAQRLLRKGERLYEKLFQGEYKNEPGSNEEDKNVESSAGKNRKTRDGQQQQEVEYRLKNDIPRGRGRPKMVEDGRRRDAVRIAEENDRKRQRTQEIVGEIAIQTPSQKALEMHLVKGGSGGSSRKKRKGIESDNDRIDRFCVVLKPSKEEEGTSKSASELETTSNPEEKRGKIIQSKLNFPQDRKKSLNPRASSTIDSPLHPVHSRNGSIGSATSCGTIPWHYRRFVHLLPAPLTHHGKMTTSTITAKKKRVRLVK